MVPRSLAKQCASWFRSRSSAAMTSSSPRCPSAGYAIRQTGTPLPATTLDAALESDAVLLGAVGGNEFNSLAPDRRPEAGLLQLRQALGGFANLRPSFAYPALSANSPLASGSHRRRGHSVCPRVAGRPVFWRTTRLEPGERSGLEHHALYPRRGRPGGPRGLPAGRASGARRLPR